MNIWTGIVVAIAAYLVGGISFSRFITRLVAPDLDLENVRIPTTDGSEGTLMHSVGATTASFELGPRVGCTIGLLDILKGVIPVMTLKLWYPQEYHFLIAAVFVVIGHNWPIYHRFRGGGGISPTYGGYFVVDFIGTIVSAFAGLFLGFFIVKDIMIAYMSGLWFMLLWLIIFKGEWPYILYGIVMNLIFILGVYPELKNHIQKKRAGTLEMGTSMEKFPMGRGMLKIMKFFGISTKENKD